MFRFTWWHSRIEAVLAVSPVSCAVLYCWTGQEAPESRIFEFNQNSQSNDLIIPNYECLDQFGVIPEYRQSYLSLQYLVQTLTAKQKGMARIHNLLLKQNDQIKETAIPNNGYPGGSVISQNIDSIAASPLLMYNFLLLNRTRIAVIPNLRTKQNDLISDLALPMINIVMGLVISQKWGIIGDFLISYTDSSY